MFSKKLHIEQIERFHRALENITKQLELETDEAIKLDLLKMYFTLANKVWVTIDNFTEDLKDTIDKIIF